MLTHWKNPTPPATPFYAVIFISQKDDDREGYDEMDDLLMKEAQKQPGYLGYSTSSNPEGGIFISYWESEEAIENWRNHTTHKEAKSTAYKKWYCYWHSMITKVESSRFFGEQQS